MLQKASHQAPGPEAGVEEGEGAPHDEVHPGPLVGGPGQGLEEGRVGEVVELEEDPALGVAFGLDVLQKKLLDGLPGPEEGEPGGPPLLEGPEELGHLHDHLLPGGEEGEVRVLAAVLRVVVAGAQVGVAPLLGEEEEGLGVDLPLREGEDRHPGPEEAQVPGEVQ